MPDGIYEQDVLVWTEQQADLLRRLAAGERVNDAVDWPNLIEEIEALGRSELRSYGSLLRQAIVHLLRIRAWPNSRAVGHWKAETFAFLNDAREGFTPSMRHRIEIGPLYAYALQQVHADTDESGEPSALPTTCPFTLDDLLVSKPDLQTLAARLGTQAA